MIYLLKKNITISIPIMAAVFSSEELEVMGRIIDKGFRNGLFTASESIVVSRMYEKILRLTSSSSSSASHPPGNLNMKDVMTALRSTVNSNPNEATSAQVPVSNNYVM